MAWHNSIAKTLIYRALSFVLHIIIGLIFIGGIAKITLYTIVVMAACTILYFIYERVWKVNGMKHDCNKHDTTYLNTTDLCMNPTYYLYELYKAYCSDCGQPVGDMFVYDTDTETYVVAPPQLRSCEYCGWLIPIGYDDNVCNTCGYKLYNMRGD